MRTFSGKKIKERRLSIGMTQKHLAMLAKTKRPHLSAIETNKHSPSANLISRISYALGVEEGYFFEQSVR